MFKISRQGASAALQGLVQGYEVRQGDLGSAGPMRVPLAAQTGVALDFYFSASTVVENRATGDCVRPPSAVIIGPQTQRRTDVIVSGRVDVFSVQLRATALHALFGIPMQELTNGAVDAAELFGPALTRELLDRMAQHSTLVGRAAVLEHCLMRLPVSARPDPIGLAAQLLQTAQGQVGMAQLAQTAGLSPRHFSRLFNERVGMPPKLYARVLRLHAALQAKARHTEASWAEVAQEAGYFDQAHLNKDFRELADATPTAFAQSLGLLRSSAVMADSY